MKNTINTNTTISANNTIVDGTRKVSVPKIIDGLTVTQQLEERKPTYQAIVNQALRQMNDTGLPFAYIKIPLAFLTVFKQEEGGYQRPLSAEKIKKNKREFNMDRVNAILVNYRDGKFYVIDGQHTLELLIEMGETEGFAKILLDRSFKYESELFYKQDDGNSRVAAWDKYLARIAAGEPIALIGKKVCDKYGITIKNRNHSSAIGPSKSMHLYSIRKLDEIVRKGGEDGLEFTIQTIMELGWHKYDIGFTENMLQLFVAYKYCDGNKNNYSKLMGVLRAFATPTDFVLEAQHIYSNPLSSHPENPVRKYIEAIFNA
jgi:hypothetical protein